jgi:hypothetical protein
MVGSLRKEKVVLDILFSCSFFYNLLLSFLLDTPKVFKKREKILFFLSLSFAGDQNGHSPGLFSRFSF